MRFTFVLDTLYTLSSVHGLPNPLVCRPLSKPLAGVEIASAPVTAFVGVSVVPMDTERVLTDQTVVVENGRIVALGPTAQIKVPAGAERIQGQGKYLMPGLADMHTPHKSSLEGFTRPDTRRFLFERLAEGVTLIRPPEGGDVDPRAFDQYFRADSLVPRMYSGRQVPLTTRPDSVAAIIAGAKAAGYRYIGLPHGSMRASPAEQYVVLDSIVAAARRAGLPVASHNHQMPLGAALAIGTTGGSVEHLSGVFWDSLGYWDPRLQNSSANAPAANAYVAKIQPVAKALQRSGVWVTPTLQCLEAHRWFTPAHDQVMRQTIQALQHAGAGMLLAGDDAFDVHDELAALVRAGLSPYQALVTGTRNPAQFFGLLDSSGTVTVGKQADLVLLYGNPLEDIRHAREPAGVMLAGRWVGRAELDQRLLAPFGEWFTTIANDVLRRSTSEEERGRLRVHGRSLRILAASVSLAESKSAEHERLLRRLSEELGMLRGMLQPVQLAVFDVKARVWLQEQARRGRPMTIPGIAVVS